MNRIPHWRAPIALDASLERLLHVTAFREPLRIPGGRSVGGRNAVASACPHE
jgi:hypothetical protein